MKLSVRYTVVNKDFRVYASITYNKEDEKEIIKRAEHYGIIVEDEFLFDTNEEAYALSKVVSLMSEENSYDNEGRWDGLSYFDDNVSRVRLITDLVNEYGKEKAKKIIRKWFSEIAKKNFERIKKELSVFDGWEGKEEIEVETE